MHHAGGALKVIFLALAHNRGCRVLLPAPRDVRGHVALADGGTMVASLGGARRLRGRSHPGVPRTVVASPPRGDRGGRAPPADEGDPVKFRNGHVCHSRFRSRSRGDAGRSGGGMIVDTFGTPARIGDSSDSSGVEGGKRSRDGPQRHKGHEGRDCFDGLSLCVFVPYVMPGTAAQYRSRLLSHAPELIFEVDAYFVALDSIYEIGHRVKMTLS